MERTLLVTGGAGFIGSEIVRTLMATTDARVVNVDRLTYAANLDSLRDVEGDPRYTLETVDIADRPVVPAQEYLRDRHVIDPFRTRVMRMVQ